MSREHDELRERAERGREDHSLAPVSLSMAILAVFIAAVSLMGHRAETEELLLQNKATDNWSFYQAKNIRRHNDQMFADVLSVLQTKEETKAAELRDKYRKESERYQEEQKEIEAEARKLEKETDHARREANRFDLGEVFLEVGLVLASITLLTRRRLYWMMGVLLGAAGVVAAITGFFLH